MTDRTKAESVASPLLNRADKRIVLTLDAGGTNFAFSALKGDEPVGDSCVLPSCGDDLEASLDNLQAGFRRVIASLDAKPAAISFAFPGPADYPSGVVFNVGNLPAYRDGVAIAPFLEDAFDLPTFVNNDGDLFALGEASAGLLPQVNDYAKARGSNRICRNLFAVTLGTGLGGGAVVDGTLVVGDNSSAAEIWRLPSGLCDTRIAEEDASIRAVRLAYACAAGIGPAESPTPAEIARIANGEHPGNQQAARHAFEKLGEAVGITIATATCFLDGVVVIGGGLSGAADLFMPALVSAIRTPLMSLDGRTHARVPHQVDDLRTDEGLAAFASPVDRLIAVPRSARKVACRPEPRLGIGVSRLGTNQATAIGAYVFAIQRLGGNKNLILDNSDETQ